MPCIVGVGLASYVMECFVFLLEALMQETYVDECSVLWRLLSIPLLTELFRFFF